MPQKLSVNFFSFEVQSTSYYFSCQIPTGLLYVENCCYYYCLKAEPKLLWRLWACEYRLSVTAGVMGADALLGLPKQIDDARAEVWVERSEKVWVERSEEVLVAASEEGLVVELGDESVEVWAEEQSEVKEQE